MITLGLAQYSMGSLVQTSAREGAGPRTVSGPTPAPEGPLRKLGWAVLTALAILAAGGAATWVGRQIVEAVQALIAVHRAVQLHEMRLAALEKYRAHEEASRTEERQARDRLVELLENEAKARAARRRR